MLSYIWSKHRHISIGVYDIKREFVETIRDPYEVQRLGFELIKNTEEEILILFSTANAFRRQEKAGALDLLKEAASQRGVRVRILVPIDDDDGDNNKAIITANEKIRHLKELGIDIRQIKKEGKLDRLQNAFTILIVDQSVCLTVELEEETQETSDEAIGLATYSNSESTVFAYRIAMCLSAEIIKNYYFLFNYDLSSSNLTLSILDVVWA